MTELIESLSNRAVVETVKLHQRKYRRSRARVLVEGPLLLQEAVAAGAIVETVFATPGPGLSLPPSVRVVAVTPRVLARISTTESPRSPVAVVAMPEFREPEARDTVALVDVADPGNVGTLIRTAAALEFQVAVTPDTADVWSPKALRAGAGAQFGVEMASIEDPLSRFGAIGVTTVALVVEGGRVPSEALTWPGPVALLVGAEAQGLSREVISGADHRVSLPISGAVESLNAAVAGSLAIWERARLRRHDERRERSDD